MQILNIGVLYPTNLLHNKMDRISTKFYVIDNRLFKSIDIDYHIDVSDYHTYEVMRCTEGVLVFVMDHLKRMREGIKRLKGKANFSEASANSNLLRLIKNVGDFEGNIKLLGKVSDQKVIFAAYGIPHQYPDNELYKKGIRIRTVSIERPNPLIKQVQVANSISEEIEKIKDVDFYESLLVDHNDCLTEGSKSNFFLIRDNCLFSAPDVKILHGITRKYVLKIASQNKIPVINKNINKNELEKYEAAFICGTSPKILPVRKINQIQYNPENPIIKILIESYIDILKQHILQQNSQLNSE